MASILLGRLGVPNLLVEKHPSTSLFPKATRLNTRTMEILRVLGIEPEVRSQEQQVAGLPLMLGGETLRGPVRFRIDGDARDDTSHYSPTTWAYMPQDSLEPIFRAHAERQAASSVRFGIQVTSLDQDAEGVAVGLLGRESDEPHLVRARYVVGADGARSFVRTALGIGMSGDERRSRELNILVRADLDSARGANRSLLFQVRNEVMQGVIAMAGDGRWALRCPEFPDVTPERCVGLVRTAAGVPDLPVEVLAISRWEQAAVVADRFRVGRVLLAGDAAHRLTPAGGFGLNTGVQDAHNLAWKLSAVLAGWAGDRLLDSYELERRPVALRNVELSRRFWDRGRVSAATGYWLGFSYPQGALIPDGSSPPAVSDPVSEYVPTARPGSRAPHCWLSTDPCVSTLDLFDREFVLLTDRGDGDWWSAASRLAAAGVPIRFIDLPAAAWAEVYGVEPGGSVLVRPDGHVAWRSRDAARSRSAAEHELRSVAEQILCRRLRARDVTRPRWRDGALSPGVKS
jgi:2-polyprenyl-6-methoxyphenol hydroxylase-like FAD-dependent oxidoreductase